MNGAQLAGSWAVRETFVAVVTTNLPMLSPLIQSVIRAIPGARLRSWFSSRATSRRRASDKHTSQTGERRSIQLQEGNDGRATGGKQRGRDPKSLYHITMLSESEERIMGATGQSLQQDMIRERDEAPERDDESGRASQLGGIQIQQQVEVTVTREPTTLSPTELEHRKMFGYVAQAPADVGTSTTCGRNA